MHHLVVLLCVYGKVYSYQFPVVGLKYFCPSMFRSQPRCQSGKSVIVILPWATNIFAQPRYVNHYSGNGSSSQQNSVNSQYYRLVYRCFSSQGCSQFVWKQPCLSDKPCTRLNDHFFLLYLISSHFLSVKQLLNEETHQDAG